MYLGVKESDAQTIYIQENLHVLYQMVLVPGTKLMTLLQEKCESIQFSTLRQLSE